MVSLIYKASYSTLVYKVSCSILAFSVAWAMTAAADEFEEGLEAFNSADYSAALAAWMPLAESGDFNAMYNIADSLSETRLVASQLTRNAKPPGILIIRQIEIDKQLFF